MTADLYAAARGLAVVLADYDAGRIQVPFAPKVVAHGETAAFHRAWAERVLAALDAPARAALREWLDNLHDRQRWILDNIVVGATGCWEWQLSFRTTGYGQVTYNGRNWNACRLAWTLFRGPIPEDRDALHHCDNKRCVNPDHLYIGTAKDNARDAVLRGQHPRASAKGSRNGIAKLTEADVIEMRRLYATGAFTSRALAEKYGITPSTAHRVINGARWKHVPLAALTDPATDGGVK